MKKLLIVGLLIVGLNANAGIDKGNGGSGVESNLVGQQAHLESVALKIKTFFKKNEESLRPAFPEFDIQLLVKRIETSDIRVVDVEELIDKNGKSRSCLNFPNSSLIECKSKDIEKLLDQSTALFVLVFHEYLGLIGAEETSLNNPHFIDGYPISKRLAPYVTLLSDYDLVLNQAVNRSVLIGELNCGDGTITAQVLLNTMNKKTLISDLQVQGKIISLESVQLFQLDDSNLVIKAPGIFLKAKIKSHSKGQYMIGTRDGTALIDGKKENYRCYVPEISDF